MSIKPWKESPQAAAVYYATRGMRIFPCGADKRPLILEWQIKATTAIESILAWWKIWPFAEPGYHPFASLAILDLERQERLQGFQASRRDSRSRVSDSFRQKPIGRHALILLDRGQGLEERHRDRRNRHRS
jgi:hypothetical protein